MILVALHLDVIHGLGLISLSILQGVGLLAQFLLGHGLVLFESSQLMLILDILLLCFNYLGGLRGQQVLMFLDQILRSNELPESTIMANLQLAVLIMHRVELAFKLEAQLDFFLVVLRVLHILFLKFESKLLLRCPLLLKEVIVVAHSLHVLLHDFLAVDIVLDFLFMASRQIFHLLLMPVC